MKHQLEADSIHLRYGTRVILSSIYLKLETGRVTGLLGRNGSGKTSLIKLIYGNLKGDFQSIRFNDKHVAEAYKQPGLIALLPQFNYIPKGLTLKRVFSDYESDYDLFVELFPGFEGKADFRMKSLSGGEQRLVELFLVLKCKTKFLILDEPFSHLTPVLTEQLKPMIKEAAQTKGILMTDHLFNDIIDIADEIYLLSNSNIRLIKDLKELEFFGYLKKVD